MKRSIEHPQFEQGTENYVGPHLCCRDHRIFFNCHRLHLRMREAVNFMENIIVGAIAVVLIIYLFVSLIRPELF